MDGEKVAAPTVGFTAEGNAVAFFSRSYSYKQTTQAAGRIDRLNTPYTDLYFYTLKSFAPVDVAIGRALSRKRNFNERAFLQNWN